jgi:hypothetical protein
MSQYRLGSRPLTHDARDLLFAAYRKPILAVPADFGHYSEIPSWGMLANDRYGDCDPAGLDHAAMLYTAEGSGKPCAVLPKNTLADYFAMNGVQPGEPGSASDQGTDPRVGLKYFQKVGMEDADGKRHKIEAYVSLEPGNLQQLAEGTYLCGASGVALNLPESAQTQFSTGVWSVVPGAPIEGGHWVICVGRQAGYYLLVSWGGVVKATAGFLTKYMAGGFGMLSEQVLNAHGRSPEGFDWAQLQADLAAL